MRKAYLGQTGVFSDSECSCELTGEKSQLIVIISTSNLDKELFTLHHTLSSTSHNIRLQGSYYKLFTACSRLIFGIKASCCLQSLSSQGGLRAACSPNYCSPLSTVRGSSGLLFPGGWSQLFGLQQGGRNDLDRIVLRFVKQPTNRAASETFLVQYSPRLNRALYPVNSQSVSLVPLHKLLR